MYIDFLLFLVFSLNILIAFGVLLKSKFKPESLLISAFTAASAFWALGVALFRSLPQNLPLLLMADRLLISSGALIASPFLHFAMLFSGRKPTLFEKFFIHGTAVVFVVLSFVPNALIEGIYSTSWGRVSVLGYAYPFFTAYFVVYYIFGFFFLGRAFLKAHGNYRNQLIYILTATFFTCTIDMVFNVVLVPFVNYKFVWAGPLSGFLWVSIMVYAFSKHELLGIKVVINRTASFVITLFMFSLVYLTLIVWPYYEFVSHSIDLGFLTVSILFGGFGVGLFFHKVQHLVQTSTGKTFFELEYDFEKTLKEVSTTLVTALQPYQTVDAIMTIRDSLEIGDSYAFLKQDNSEGFDCFKLEKSREYGDENQQNKFIQSFEGSHPFIRFLNQSSEKILVFSDMPKDVTKSLGQMDIRGKSICMGLRAFGELQAVFIIGQRLSEESYSEKDVTLFEVVANQAEIVFERHTQTQRLMDSKAQLEILNTGLEKRVEEKVAEVKLALRAMETLSQQASLSSLTLGISHELRNPLTDMKSNAYLLKTDLEGAHGYDWHGKINKTLLAFELGSETMAETVIGFLYAQGWIDSQSILVNDFDPFDPQFQFFIPGLPKESLDIAQQHVMDAFNRKQCLDHTRATIENVDRLVSITETMMRYGMAGQGVSKSAFSRIQGISQDQSELIFYELVNNHILDTQGGILEGFNPSQQGFTLGLPPQFLQYEEAIVSLLKQVPGAPVKQLISMQLIIEDALKMSAGTFKKSGVQIQKEFSPCESVMADKTRLFQVFSNLFKNSVQAMQFVTDRPKVLRCVMTPAVFLNTDAKECTGLLVTLSDTGCGIPQEHLSRIHDPFFSTKGPTGGKNIGLGLSIVLRVMQNHGGRIDVESEVGVGTTFKLYFPT